VVAPENILITICVDGHVYRYWLSDEMARIFIEVLEEDGIVYTVGG
jgi:hypothetical protein